MTLRARAVMGLTTAALCGLGASLAKASPMTLSQVPAYNWYHGCGPTAAGSILGYWDLHGYDNLFTASGWDQVRLTANVQDQISSPQHNARYDPKPDDLTQPQSWNSIADWFRTSSDPQEYGWSNQGYADDAFEGYANYRGYTFDAYWESWSSLAWSELVNEIDLGNPMMFLVDTDGNGATDHFVPVLGYDDRGPDGLWYGLYTTWSETETVNWQQFQSLGNPWGIGYATYVHPLVPAPAAALVGFVGVGMVGWCRRRKLLL